MSNGRLPDGSYLAEIKGKIPDIQNSTQQQKQWKKETLIVRVIEYQIPGFRPCRLIDPDETVLIPVLSKSKCPNLYALKTQGYFILGRGE
jgi:hypothetical protein